MSELVDRLRARALAAREEGTATAVSDALHFEEAADRIVQILDALSDAAYIACLEERHDPASEWLWFVIGWKGGLSRPNNEEQAWLYKRGMDVRAAASPREVTVADGWCRHFTDRAVISSEPPGCHDYGRIEAHDHGN